MKIEVKRWDKFLCITNKVNAKKGKIYPAFNEKYIDVLGFGTDLYPISHDVFQPLSSAKWAIKITEENKQYLIDWVQKQPYFDKRFDIENEDAFSIEWYVVSSKDDASYQHWSKSPPRGYTEIDFETFKEITGMVEEQKIFTIEDVRNGKCAIENDGTVEELNKALKATFPKDKVTTSGSSRLYQAGTINKEIWNNNENCDLPTQSVKLFLSQIEGEKTPIQKAVEKLGKVRVKEIIDEVAAKQPNKEWQPKWGEGVEGRFSNGSAWIPCKYCCQSTVNEFGFICEFGDGALSRAIAIRKPLPIHTFTTEQAKQDLAKLHNLNPEQIKITE